MGCSSFRSLLSRRRLSALVVAQCVDGFEASSVLSSTEVHVRGRPVAPTLEGLAVAAQSDVDSTGSRTDDEGTKTSDRT